MANESAMQERFGAKIRIEAPAQTDSQLFLIIGGPRSRVAGLVSGLDGRPVLYGPGWMIAEMGFTRAMALRGSPGVGMVGGVSMDLERFNQLRDMTKIA